MKKFLIGFSVVGSVLGFIYLAGVFRHYLEDKLNNGNEYSVLFGNRYAGKIDYSIASTYVDGISTLITIFFSLIFVVSFILMCYKIGDDFVALKDE